MQGRTGGEAVQGEAVHGDAGCAPVPLVHQVLHPSNPCATCVQVAREPPLPSGYRGPPTLRYDDLHTMKFPAPQESQRPQHTFKS